MSIKILSIGLIAVAIIAIGAYFFPKELAQFGNSGSRFIYGLSTNSTSPSAGEVRTTDLTVSGDEFSVGDIDFAYVQVTMNTATTTLCTIPNPWSATSTVIHHITDITVGTSTALVFDLATSSSITGTSTPVWMKGVSLASASINTFFWNGSSATTTSGVLPGVDQSTNMSNYFLGPTDKLNVKSGAGAGGYTFTGTCSALFMKS